MNDLISDVLRKAWTGGFSTQSNFARSHAQAVAAAASVGLITTSLGGMNYGNRWYITKKGLESYDECYKRN
jgi:hypothetical protein